jgi:hyperosmotically inducible periplasmic protein
MKKLILFLISGILVVGAFGCQETSHNASQNPSTTNESSQLPVKSAAQTTQTTGKTAHNPGKETSTAAAKTTTEKTTATKNTTATTKTESELKTEVTKKLKAGLPGNKLEVAAKADEIVIKGTANSPAELQKAEKLAKEVPGVKTVKLEAKILLPNKI